MDSEIENKNKLWKQEKQNIVEAKQENINKSNLVQMQYYLEALQPFYVTVILLSENHILAHPFPF